MDRRRFLKGLAGAGVAAAGIGACASPSSSPGARAKWQTAATFAPEDEFIRVADDRWSFETARSRTRFVPFGSNLVLTSKEDLNIFGPRYSEERYRAILAACERVHINLLKVFLPIGSALPDPQVPGQAQIAPGYLDNLDNFLGLCRTHHVRAVVTLCEWGGSGCTWWQEGGQYFGRRPWKREPGIDSLDILARFWTSLATRLRDNPSVFSYTPCVEWSLPNGNLTPPWAPPDEQIGLVPGDVALWYWRNWALAKYGSLDILNRAWGAKHTKRDEVAMVNYAYDMAGHQYVDPDAKILDYQNFREWATLRYFVPQIAAIRAADPNHMVTISNHMRSWNLWEGAARHFLGYTPAEESRLVDYVTHHANYDEDSLKDGRGVESIVRELEVMVRFAHAALRGEGTAKPIIIEEFTFGSPDTKRNAEVQAAMVRGTRGHASGWTTWYLQYPEGAGVADAAFPSAWLAQDLTPTPWGETARALFEELAHGDLARIPARRTVTLDRATELVPKKTGVLINTFQQYASFEQPTDYVAAHEPDLDLKLAGDDGKV